MKLLLPLLLLASLLCHGQTTFEEVTAVPQRAGGIYMAYPVAESRNTAPPEGYEPFYVSHYGRHGSRYLISDGDYRWPLDLLARADSAGALTPLGRDVLARLERVWPEAELRGGDLTPLGARQHRDIARRMYDAFPQAFGDSAEVTAKSTVVMRCAMSMAAFAQGLKERNPRLDISLEASERNMGYLNHHTDESNLFTGPDGPLVEEYRKFKDELTQPDRLVAALFADPEFVRRNVNPKEVMWGLYWIAVDMQNMESREEFLDLFTPQELWDLWRVNNYGFYMHNTSHPRAGGLLVDNAKPLLRNIVESADDKIARHASGADLRFGHDGNLMPLAAILRLEGCYGEEADPYKVHQVNAGFKISPMAGNVQIVFYRDKRGEVLCKFMLNERETRIPVPTRTFPFYRWDDVRAFYKGILEGNRP